MVPSIDSNDHYFGDLESRLLNYSSNVPYQKLTHSHFNLSLLKLDGSSFDVYIAKDATIGKLKEAVEDVFRLNPIEGEPKVSWSHIWGHFCLCHEGRKLLNDKIQIQHSGIKDGDELNFIQHITINFTPVSPVKYRSKKTCAHSRHFSVPSLDIRDNEQGKQTSIHDNDTFINDQFDFNPRQCDEDKGIQVPRFKLARPFQSRLSYTRLKACTRKRILGRNQWSLVKISKLTLNIFGLRVLS